VLRGGARGSCQAPRVRGPRAVVAGAALDEFARDLQVEAHGVPMPRRITPLADLAALWRIVRVHAARATTIVDAHTPKGGLLAMMAAALCRVPVRIYHQHGLPLMTATGLKRRILRGTGRPRAGWRIRSSASARCCARS